MAKYILLSTYQRSFGLSLAHLAFLADPVWHREIAAQLRRNPQMAERYWALHSPQVRTIFGRMQRTVEQSMPGLYGLAVAPYLDLFDPLEPRLRYHPLYLC